MGPKTEVQLGSSRQFPEVSESREFRDIALLLDYIYSDKFENRDILLWSLLRQSGIIYGKCIEPISLRYAAAALSAALLPQCHFQGHLKRYTNAAYGQLKIILKRGPNRISESDVFATFLLGLVATVNPLNSPPVASYTKGCLLMLGVCFTSKTPPSNRMLNDFGPLILDWLEIFHLRRNDPVKWNDTYNVRRRLFNGKSPFDQRLKYVQLEHENWRSGVGWALRYTLAILADKLIWMIPVIARKELHSQSEGQEYVEDVFESVKSELRDKQFRDAIAQSELWEEEIPVRYVRYRPMIVNTQCPHRKEINPIST